MKVGVLKEIKAEENRVTMTPAGVEVMKQNGHIVLIEKNAGRGSGFNDEAYVNAGAEIPDVTDAIFDRCEMIMR
ncbi:MAG: alanine dehydrogenase, partial [Candidatus Aminicenantes bacterium]|nr:alanine dehydrogenase [Candidatus Aminicenantes bacterium]